MEALDPDRLQAILDLLVTSGVEEFEGFGFHVRFTPSLFTKDKEVPADSYQTMDVPEPQRGDPDSVWRVPELWPGGKPPSFPTK